jgi:hypothetical protein
MFAGRVRDRTAAQFGEKSVFIDVDNIPFGKDFRVHIQEEMARADVVLVIIGSKWLGLAKGGYSRIREETDPVRIEVETALAKGIPTIPVLVGQAKMPKPEQLPDSLRDFSFINAASVDTGRDFHRDLDRVIAAIAAILERPPQAERSAPVSAELARAEGAPQIATAAKSGPSDRTDAKTEAVAAVGAGAAEESERRAGGSAVDSPGQGEHGGTAASAGPARSSRGSRLLLAAIAVVGLVAAGLAWRFLSAPHEPAAVQPAAQAQAPPNASATPQSPPQSTPPSPQYNPAAPPPQTYAADPGAAVVRQFYQYLAAGDGDDAAKLVVAEKRTGNFSPQKLTQFYSSVQFQLVSVVPYGQNAYRVTYTYQTRNAYQTNVCNDTVTVTVTQRAGQYFIQRIEAPGC